MVGLGAMRTGVWCSTQGGQIMQGVAEEGLPTLCLQCRKLEKPLKQTQGHPFCLGGDARLPVLFLGECRYGRGSLWFLSLVIVSCLYISLMCISSDLFSLSFLSSPHNSERAAATSWGCRYDLPVSPPSPLCHS